MLAMSSDRGNSRDEVMFWRCSSPSCWPTPNIAITWSRVGACDVGDDITCAVNKAASVRRCGGDMLRSMGRTWLSCWDISGRFSASSIALYIMDSFLTRLETSSELSLVPSSIMSVSKVWWLLLGLWSSSSGKSSARFKSSKWDSVHTAVIVVRRSAWK